MDIFSEVVYKIFKAKKIMPLDRNTILEFRYKYIEEFDFTYTLNFIAHKLKQKEKPLPVENLLAINFLQYVYLFEDRNDKLVFCKKFIKRVEFDKEGFFKDEPDFKEGLLIIYRAEWDSLLKVEKGSIQDSNVIQRLSNIEKNIDLIPVLQNHFEQLVNSVRINKRKGKRKVPSLSYAEIFKNQKVGEELKNIFKNYNYINNEGNWLGQSKTKNELAIAFYVLRESIHEFHLIIDGNKKQQLIVFYKEFGLVVTDSSEINSDTTYRNIATERAYGDTHDEFKQLFKPLLKYKS